MAEVYKLKYLTRGRLRTFLAVANRIIPANADAPAAGEMITAGIVDYGMERMPKALRTQFLLLISAIEILGLPFGFKPFSKCSPAAQDRALKFLESAPVAPLRMGFFGIKTYICMGYYGREDIWKTIGYDGPLDPNRPFADPLLRALCQSAMEVAE